MTESDKPRYVFLDFNGVLDTPSYVAEHDPFSGATELDEAGLETFLRATLDPKLVRRVSEAVAASEAKTVISSSWRGKLRLPTLRRVLADLGYEGEIVGKIRPEDPSRGRTRGKMILDWIGYHPASGYVVIDDEPEENDLACLPIVATDGTVGFSERNAEHLIELLGGRRTRSFGVSDRDLPNEKLETAYSEGRYPWEPGSETSPEWFSERGRCECSPTKKTGSGPPIPTPSIDLTDCPKCRGTGKVAGTFPVPQRVDDLDAVLRLDPTRLREIPELVRVMFEGTGAAPLRVVWDSRYVPVSGASDPPPSRAGVNMFEMRRLRFASLYNKRARDPARTEPKNAFEKVADRIRELGIESVRMWGNERAVLLPRGPQRED